MAEDLATVARSGAAGERPASRPRRKPALGVLFVHGIGSQLRGQTLTECVSALLGCWLPRLDRTGGDAGVERTVLTVGGHEYEPAHSVVDLKATRDGEASRVLLAESWWASEFLAPPYRAIASWVLTYGSWVVISHVVDHVRGRFKRLRPHWARRVLTPAVELVAVAAAAGALFVVQVFLLLLGILALLPIPPLRRAAAAAVLSMESFVGDSYAFSGNAVVSSAVVSRVSRDIEWLAERCDLVVVVAHSQGAAVAVRALEQHVRAWPERTAMPQRVRKLITYGSGLLKLTQLELMTRPPRGYPGLVSYCWIVVAGVALITPAVAWMTYLAVAEAVAGGVSSWMYILSNPLRLPVIEERPLEYLFLVTLLFIGLASIRHFADVGDEWAGHAREAVRRSIRQLTPHLAWTDVYASRDPVPGAPIAGESGDGFRTHPVTNHSSALTDHVAYWRNPDEFVTLVVEELNEVVPVVPALDPATRERAAARRRARITALAWTRRTIVAAAAVSIISQAEWLEALGREHLIPALAPALPDWFSGLLARMAAGDSAIPQALGALAYFACAAVLPALAAWLWYRLPCREAWEYWDRTEIRDFLRSSASAPEVKRVALGYMMAAVTIFCLVAAWTAVRGYAQFAGDLVKLWELLQERYRTFMG